MNKEKHTKLDRSPAYPRVDLKTALDRAQQVYQHENKNRAPRSAIFEHWGYKLKSDSARTTLASLRYYGLVNVEGRGDGRTAQLTDLALDILLDNREDTSERENLIKKAALTPTINAELWNEYKGNFPSHQSLKYSLLREKGFTERGVEDFISSYQSTLEFAKLTSDSDTPTPDEGKEHEDDSMQQTNGHSALHHATQQPQHLNETGQNVQLPLSSDSWAVLSAQFPLTEQNWKQMISVLNAMKPALVENAEK